MKLQVDGRDVFATTYGIGLGRATPAIVFLHGAGFSNRMWRRQARWFAHHGRSVLGVDFPAHGYLGSTGPALESIAEMADWTAHLIAAAGLKKAALVGHSMGALAALDCAARYPGAVRALALCGVAIEMPPPQMREPSDLPYGDTLYHDYSVSHAYRDAAARAAAVTCPTVLVLGDRDHLTPVAKARPLAAAIAHAKTVVVRGCGHLIMYERPDVMLEALKPHV